MISACVLFVCFFLPSVLSSIISTPHSPVIGPLSLSSLLSRQVDLPDEFTSSKCSDSGTCPSNRNCAKFSDNTPRCFPGICVECTSDSDCSFGSCIFGTCNTLLSSYDGASDCPAESACLKSNALSELPGACVGQEQYICTSSDACPIGTSCFSFSLTAFRFIDFSLDGKPFREIGVCLPGSVGKCTADANCSNGTLCVKRKNGEGICLPTQSKCDKDGDCAIDDGQVCLKFGENGEGICNADPAEGLFPIDGKCRNGGKLEGGDGLLSGDEENGVCVDAGLLEEAGVEDFVFGNHRMARVLCDKMGSCATAGHMVEWNGVGMMMKTYCEIEMNGRCEEKVIKVNSPKWTKGRRVGTKTTGLEFTAVAARYESRMEEVVLKMGIRMGM